MLIFVVRRLVTGVVLFVSVTALTYVLFYSQGGLTIARKLLPITEATPVLERAFAEHLGLLAPLPVQYVRWLGSVFSGTFGFSFISGEPVSSVLADRLPVTLSLIVVSLLLTVVVGGVLGVAAATRGGWIDRVLQVLAVVVQAIPAIWLALILVIVFGLTLRVVPATGYIPLSDSFSGWLSSVIVPSFAIALGSVPVIATQLRGSLRDTLGQDFVRTLRSRGISRSSIIFKHGLRNAAGPTLTLLSLQVIGTLAAAVVVERIYALPGLGNISVTAGTGDDIPIVLGVTAYMAVIVVVVNLAVDVANGFLNPRVRLR